MTKLFKFFASQRFIERTSAAVISSILYAISLNFFLQPGRVYSSGLTGVAQIVESLFIRGTGHEFLSIPILYWIFNFPLLVLAWVLLGKRFTLFTMLSVTLSTVLAQYIPTITLTKDPIMNAIFGGVLMGISVGYAMRNGLSGGGTDIVSLAIRKKTGASVGFIGNVFNGIVIVLAGVLFGWKYMFYSLIYVFVCGQLMDAVFNKQQKMQVTIVTVHPEEVKDAIYQRLGRGVTIVRGVEGGYSHQIETILITVITAYEYQEFKDTMKESDPKAFVSVAQSVRILGNFDDEAGQGKKETP